MSNTFGSVQLGQVYRTGQTAPVSGVYEFAGHVDGSYCSPTSGERYIPLAKGETFPPHRRCNKSVLWRLSRFA